MAINIPIVTEFVDAGLKSAQGAFDNFRMKVGEAEGGLGKLKAGANAAFDGIKANAMQMAIGAGTAIAGFAVKAIGEFQSLALEVDKFSNATGLAAEEASRWIEAAGDIGIESNTLITAFNRLNRAVGDNSKAFDELGVEIVRTADGATDVNATFLETIDALRNVDDPAKRARLATQLLGKSWTELSEMVEMGATELSAALEGVSDAKVIDEKEIQKAKDFRAAQDALADAFQDFTLALGEKLLPALTRLLPLITAIAKAGGDLVDAVGGGDGVTAELLEMGVTIDEIVRNANDPESGIEMVMRDLGLTFEEVADVIGDDLLPENYRLNKAWEEGSRAMIDAYQATKDLTDSFISLDDAVAELKAEIDEREAWRNLLDTIDDVRDAAVKAFTEATPEALRDSESALDRARLKAAEYIAQLEDIPEEQRTEIIANLDNANIDQIEQTLNNLARERRAQIIADVFGGTPVTPSPVPPTLRPIGGRSASTNVTVNVAGSVVAEQDLVNSVRKGLIDSQRNGAPLVYTNR